MPKNKFLVVILVFLVIILTRLYPLIKFGPSGLGYDTGFYRRYLELSGGFLKPPSYILGTDAFSARLVLDFLSWSKINIDLALFGSYLIFSFLLGLTIYLLASQIFQNKNAGLLALCLFALSPTQWLAYTFMLYKQFWAIWLLLLSFYLIERRSSFLILPLILALTGHRATALLSIPPLFFTAVLYIIKKKKIRIILTITTAIILAVWLNWPIMEMLWTTFQNGLPIQDSFKLKTGIFISPEEYLIKSSIFIALGFIGAGYLVKKKKFGVFLFFFFTALILVLAKSYFYQRIIIFLDLSLIILGGGGLWLIYNQIKSSKYARIILAAFFLLLSPVLFFTIKSYHPLINQEKLQEIIYLRSISNDNSYIITFTSDYAPWLYGWAGPNKKIISPGLFEDAWNYEQWVNFWSGDLTKQKEMLASYRAPLYIFNPGSDYSDDACFAKISGSAWKFNCY